MLVPLTMALANAPSLWVVLHCLGRLGLTRPLKTQPGSELFCIVWASWPLTRPPENTSRPWVVLHCLSELTTDKAPWKHIQTVSGSTLFEWVDDWQGPLKTHPGREWFYIVWASWPLTRPPENTSSLWVVLHRLSELTTDKAPWKHIQRVSGSTSFEWVDDRQGPLKTHPVCEWFYIVWASQPLTRPPENTSSLWVVLHRLSKLTTDKAPWKHIQGVSGSTSFERVDNWQGPLKTHPGREWFYIVWASWPLTRPPENTSRVWVVLHRLSELTTDKTPWKHIQFVSGSTSFERVDNWQGPLKTHPGREWFYIVWGSWRLTRPPENTFRVWVVLHCLSELTTDKAPWKHIQFVSGSTSFEWVDHWQGPLKTHPGRELFVWMSFDHTLMLSSSRLEISLQLFKAATR